MNILSETYLVHDANATGASEEVNPEQNQPGASEEVNQGAEASGMEGQDTWEQREAALRSGFENDLSGLRSSYDKQIAEITKQSQSELKRLEQELHNAVTKNMTETELQQYNNQKESKRVADLERQNAELNARLTQQSQAAEWVNTFKDRFGLEIPIGANASEVVAKGFVALEKEFERLKGQTATDPQTSRTNLTPAPDVQTGMPSGDPVGAGNLDDFIKARYGGNREAFYKAVETGRLKMEDIPGFKELMDA